MWRLFTTDSSSFSKVAIPPPGKNSDIHSIAFPSPTTSNIIIDYLLVGVSGHELSIAYHNATTIMKIRSAGKKNYNKQDEMKSLITEICTQEFIHPLMKKKKETNLHNLANI